MIKTSNSITTLSFECADRLDWLKDIAEMCSALQAGNIADNVIFRFDNHSDIEKIKPVHVTSLACLIEALVAPSRSIKLHRRQDPIGEYLWTNLKFREYWAGGKNFVEASDNSIFNLWRLRNEEKEIIPIIMCLIMLMPMVMLSHSSNMTPIGKFYTLQYVISGREFQRLSATSSRTF